jgi:hypothetical protein
MGYGYPATLCKPLTRLRTSSLRRSETDVQLCYPHLAFPFFLVDQLYSAALATPFFEPRVWQFLAKVPPHCRKVAFLSSTQPKDF